MDFGVAGSSMTGAVVAVATDGAVIAAGVGVASGDSGAVGSAVVVAVPRGGCAAGCVVGVPRGGSAPGVAVLPGPDPAQAVSKLLMTIMRRTLIASYRIMASFLKIAS